VYLLATTNGGLEGVASAERAALVDAVDVGQADARVATQDADPVVTNSRSGSASPRTSAAATAFADRVREGSVDRMVALTTKPGDEIPYGRIDATVWHW
jgi:hypothetical protein